MSTAAILSQRRCKQATIPIKSSMAGVAHADKAISAGITGSYRRHNDAFAVRSTGTDASEPRSENCGKAGLDPIFS
ncbi:MAG: hypothetical protein DBW63_10005 [Hyphomonas sp.]|nr:MAG: hypothetical protein DBW63_10005 [Hyphomonas sp.]